MKIRNLYLYLYIALCVLGIQSLNAQMIDSTSITADEANIKLLAPNAFIMEIGGPNGYYFKQKVDYTNNISISNVDENGKKFEDGSYLLQITPILTLSDIERKELNDLREKNDVKGMVAYRLAHNLPAKVDVNNVYFSIRNGDFVSPNQKEIKGLSKPRMSITSKDHPSLYASLNYIAATYEKPIIGANGLSYTTDNSSMREDDQVFLDDVIVTGSICVGQDCVNGESFGFDTERLKENNLRIHFVDTSSSASFPGNDWRIVINDSANGGANYFAIEDSSAGRIPFRVMAGAGNNALYISNSGNVGMGTASPVVELHVTDGDSPTLRLEQNGSSGFGSQTWDIAGNEANFFVRDATNGSKLPFRIKPNAPTNALYIAADGDLGFGTETPDGQIDVAHPSNSNNHAFLIDPTGNIGVNIDNGFLPKALFDVQNTGGSSLFNVTSGGFVGINKEVPTVALDVVGDLKVEGTSIFTGNQVSFVRNSVSILNATTFNPLFKITASGSVGIGIAAPQSRFHVKDGLIRVDAKPGVSTIFKGYNSLAVNTYTFKHSNSDGAILELDNGSSTNTIRLRSDGSSYLNGGNVGIGTLSPTEKLQVNGTIKATDINFTGLPVYSNEAAAVSGGLSSGDCYRTATGELRIKL